MTIEDLVVLEKLDIHTIRIEKRRVSAVYSITKENGEQFHNRLFYSYKENLFDPENWQSRNLASIMLSQLALNYGLFFKRIEFKLYLDETDKSFINSMIENTSREIYVNKFLCYNEFILPPFDNLDAKKQKRYTQAEIVFKDIEKGPSLKIDGWKPSSYAILSSGGKDSLLSYGILDEIGDAHPIFINESGRHWYTAVNAFRQLSRINPNTVKPWCNSDRLFNWFLKHLSFIRPEYTRIRADIYPVRLWTVAVFVFGVLPVVLKRRIGNIVIGNEYDTSMEDNYKGISHYSGLYDQSRQFDMALTRYYKKKGWDIRQFSILRSLSELLILKILVKRYPDLQKLQVSCHAAHSQSGVMKPCGNCEKCRRIIGMMISLDENPERIGYTGDQIKRGIVSLSSKSVKQIGSDAAHLYYLLLEKGIIDQNEHNKRLAKKYDRIMHMRFDAQRSQPEDIPAYLRERIFNIFREYCLGTVELVNRNWIKID